MEKDTKLKTNTELTPKEMEFIEQTARPEHVRKV